MNLPSYRVFLNDGSNYVTSMAQGVTLEQAKAYFVGQWFTQQDERTKLQAVAVRQMHDCHICDNPNINQLNRSGWCSSCGRDIGWHITNLQG